MPSPKEEHDREHHEGKAVGEIRDLVGPKQRGTKQKRPALIATLMPSAMRNSMTPLCSIPCGGSSGRDWSSNIVALRI